MRESLLVACLFVSAITYSITSLARTELPVEAFAGLPYISNVALSPDGEKVAALAQFNSDGFTGGVVFTYNIKTGEKEYYLKTDNSKYVLNWLKWANNSVLLASGRYPDRRNGTASTETFLQKIDTETGKISGALSNKFFRDNGILPQFKDRVINLLNSDPDNILLAIQIKRSNGTGVIRLNLNKGSTKTIENQKENVYQWLTDRQDKIRIAHFFKGTTTQYLIRDVGQKKWRTLWEYDAFSLDSKTPLGFDHNPNILYYSAYHSDKLAIFKTDISVPDSLPELVYSEENYDVGGQLIYSEARNKVVGLSISSNQQIYWDTEYSLWQETIDNVLPNTNNTIYDNSIDESQFVIFSSNDKNAGTYRLWNRTNNTLAVFGSKYQDLDPKLMREKESIRYLARDELEIEGYLTRPSDGALIPLPAIIFPHGGPISNNTRGFDYWTQFFANRGYVVLQMNFRGSSGYGHDFMKSGLQNWGQQMQNDVEDGTRWLIDQGIADPNKICVVGASYGGYAALMEAANNPELYQCVVSFGGVTDIPALVKSSRRYINTKVVKAQIGSDYKDLKNRSPVEKAQDIDIPVLLVHGTKDRVVKSSQSTKMYKELNKAGKQVRYLELKDGDHYLSNAVDRVRFFTEMDQFLKQYLD